MSIPLGWLQLKHRKLRLAVALVGIAFAVVLILMQLGFQASLFGSAVRYHERLRYDIALIGKDTSFLVQPTPFSSRRLYQALGVDGVASVTPVYAGVAIWKNPWSHDSRRIFTLGIDPADDSLAAPGVRENTEQIRRRDVALFDAASRPEFGPIPEHVRRGERPIVEVNGREIEIGGLFEIGTSFGIDASLLTSDTNFLRLFPDRARTQIDIGLVRLRPGADAAAVRDRLRALLPPDVHVLTKAEYIDKEIAYWSATTPIGYVFSFGCVIGFAVGCIIVYQILFADVSDHLAEYATLKAMGYSNRWLAGVVLQQALILALLGYVPGVLVTLWLYRTAGAATRLPLELTLPRAVAVLALTAAMCAVSGFLALRKVRALDPAEIF
jgi:putative ABC transport system permease protein